MDLKSGFPYWLIKNGLPANYPALKKNHSTEVLIIGGGISGVLAAYHLSNAGFEITVVDKRHFGTGSTSASTALIQYETDEHLADLIKKYGEKKAVRCYELTSKAVKDLGKLILKHKIDCDCEKRTSLYTASGLKDKERLFIEYDARINAGLDVELWDTEKIITKFGFAAHAALWSENAMELDALKLTYSLLKILSGKGVSFFDGTIVNTINKIKNKFVVSTDTGAIIYARHVVVAGGYESEKFFNRKISKLNSTYAIISEPVNPSLLWYKQSLIWESARPYLYMRTTPDNRIIVGGKDEPFYNPLKRDQLLIKKGKELEKAFKRKFPHIPFEIDFRWTGTFAETKDSLPYIDQYKGINFIMGFGGNGITYSQMAGLMLSDLISGKANTDLKLFSFKR